MLPQFVKDFINFFYFLLVQPTWAECITVRYTVQCTLFVQFSQSDLPPLIPPCLESVMPRFEPGTGGSSGRNTDHHKSLRTLETLFSSHILCFEHYFEGYRDQNPWHFIIDWLCFHWATLVQAVPRPPPSPAKSTAGRSTAMTSPGLYNLTTLYCSTRYSTGTRCVYSCTVYYIYRTAFPQHQIHFWYSVRICTAYTLLHT